MVAIRRRRRKKFLSFDDWLNNRISGLSVYWPLQETTGAVANAINPAVALGRELVIDPGFDDATKWDLTFLGTSWSVAASVASYSGADTVAAIKSLNLQFRANMTGVLSFDISNAATNSADLYFGAGDAAVNNRLIAKLTYSNGSHVLPVTVPGTYNGANGLTVVAYDTGDTFDIDNVSFKQTNILASSVYPGPEKLNTAGASGTATAANWAKESNAALTNPSVGILRISRDGTNNPFTSQAKLTIGKRYKYVGEAKSDGNAKPFLVEKATFIQPWAGVATHTNWQPFAVEFIAGNASTGPASLTSTGTQYTEWRNISVTEVNPLNGGDTATTVGVATGIASMPYARRFNGATSFINIYSAELNSMFNPAAGTLIAFAQVANAGVWTDGSARYMVNLGVDTNNYIIVYKNSSPNNQLVCWYKAGGTDDLVTYTTSTTDAISIAFTWDKLINNKVSLYINGTLIGTSPTLGTWVGNLNSLNVTIGAYNTTPANVWNGDIAQVMLANRALTAGEIADIYQKSGI